MKRKYFVPIILIAFVAMLLPQSVFPVTSSALGLYVNVEDYGANGHDDVDDMEAIQKAIEAVCDSTSPVYGRAVYLPGGTYIIHPGPERRFVIYDNLHITGDRSAVIKVADDTGNFGHIFGPEYQYGKQEDAPCIENFMISNITIDCNAEGNTTASVDYSIYENSQVVIWLRNYDNVKIDSVQFDSCTGVNTIILGEPGKNSYIQNCYFRFAQPVNSADYDNSCIYNCGRNQVMVNNIFYSELEELGRGCIETHQGVSVVSGNISDGFNTMCNIVAVSPGQPKWSTPNDITVTNNTIDRANTGICLWGCPDDVLRNVTVSNNTISIIQATQNHITSGGITTNWINDGQLRNFDNITISNNTIKFEKETATREGVAEEFCYAIGMNAYGNISNVNIVGNIITDAPYAAIKVGGTGPFTYKNIRVKDNMIINPGANTFAKNKWYRAGIYLWGALENVVVEENMIRDDNDIFGGYQSIVVEPKDIISLRVANNDISAKQGGYYYNVPANAANVDQGDPIKIHYSNEFPITKHMTLEVGDVIYNTGTLTPGRSYSGYRVTAAGTTGTLNNVTASTTSGSSLLQVNDSSGISVGDYINVAGGGNAIRVTQITGNDVWTNRQIPATMSNAAVTFMAPTYKGFGQLARR